MTTPLIALAWLIAIGTCASLEFLVRLKRADGSKRAGEAQA